jgi:hypothetical protein
VSEPDWKTELYATLKGELDERLRAHTELAREFLAGALGGAVLPHIEAAYGRGLTAGQSQAGYRLVQENERLRRELELAHQSKRREAICPSCLSPLPGRTTAAPSAGTPSPASSTEAAGET